MRRTISILISMLSLPAVIFYANFIYLEIYYFLNPSQLIQPISLQLQELKLTRILIHLSGIIAWGCLAVMAYYWCRNQPVRQEFVVFSTMIALIGLYPFLKYDFIRSFTLLALPAILWAVYLIYWHLHIKAKQLNKPTQSFSYQSDKNRLSR